MQKIVINNCIGGFGLSNEAMIMYAELKGIKIYPYVSHYEDDVEIFTPYDPSSTEYYFCIHYATKVLEPNEDINDFYYYPDIPRNDPDLIKVVETLGKKANDRHSELKIVSIPDDVEWIIMSSDMGMEYIAEKHRIWS